LARGNSRSTQFGADHHDLRHHRPDLGAGNRVGFRSGGSLDPGIPAPSEGHAMTVRGIGRLDHACQTGRHSHAARGSGLYSTPPIAVEALLAVENLSHWIWEPCAGLGAIANVLRDRGHTVICSDLIRYDDFPLHFVGDFMLQTKAPVDCDAIVTNPPYQIAAEFTRHALDLAPHVYLLLRLAFLESIRRAEILERRGLVRVHVFRKRLPMMHRAGWDGPRASSAIPFAWFCWNRDYRGPTIVDRIGAVAS
jgi:hypothetical protein